jgi:hypothetical protein
LRELIVVSTDAVPTTRCEAFTVAAATVRRTPLALLCVTVATIVLAALAAAGAEAAAPWNTPVQVSATSMTGNQNNITFELGLFAGNAAAVWKQSDQLLNGAFLPSGATAYVGPDALSTSTAPTKVFSPAVEVGTGGLATAAWAIQDSTGSANDLIQCANRPSGAGAFAACGANVFGPSGNASQWRVGDVSLGMNQAGDAGLGWDGQGGSGFASARGSYRLGAGGAFGGGQNLSGNVGISMAGTETRPWVAFNAAGDAMEIWRTTDSSASDHSVRVAYFPTGGASFIKRTAPEDQIICCRNITVGNYRVALDGLGNGYVAAQGPAGPGNGILAAFAPRAYALGGAGGWGALQGLDDNGAQPRVAADGAGNAVVTWVRHDMATNQGTLFASYRPVGDATTFGAGVPVATNVDDSGSDEWHQVFMSPAGVITVLYRSCGNAGCTLKGVKAASAPAGGVSFGATETVQDDGALGIKNLSLAGDPQGDVLAGWSNGSGGPSLTSLRVPPAPPVGGGGGGATIPPTTPATGLRAAALKKCKKKHGAARTKCKKKANKLPV